MWPGSQTLLVKAERAAARAAAALSAGAPGPAAGRAFYAGLYAAKAVLNERGLRLHTHARIAAALARVADEELRPLADWLAASIAARRRAESDELSYDEAAAMVEQARAWVVVAWTHVR